MGGVDGDGVEEEKGEWGVGGEVFECGDKLVVGIGREKMVAMSILVDGKLNSCQKMDLIFSILRI